MPETTTCPHCGTPVPFNEDDRGFEVYCLSCGRAVLVAEESTSDVAGQGSAAEPSRDHVVDAASAHQTPPEALAADRLDEAPATEGSPASNDLPEAARAKPTAEAQPTATAAPTEEMAKGELAQDRSIAGSDVADQPLSTAAARDDSPHRGRQRSEVAESTAPDGSEKRGKIFSESGSATAEQAVVGEAMCLCGRVVPVRVEDYGSTIYCPACQSEIEVGQSLVNLAAASVRTAKVEPPPPDLPTPKARLRFVSSRLGLAMMLGVIASICVGGYLLWQYPETALQIAGKLHVLPGRYAEPALSKKAAPATAAAASDVAPPPKPPEMEEITLEQIDSLLKSANFTEALIQAQIWDELLRELGVRSDDPRRERLAEVIATLQRRLTPTPKGPPPCIEEFRATLDRLSVALKHEDLSQAEQAIEEAAALVEAHPDDLGPYCRRFLLLKARFEKLQAIAHGVERIDESLDKALAMLEQGQVTRAIEYDAVARSMATRTPLKPEEVERLDEKVRDLIPKIRFARGKRAIEDALDAQKGQDTKTRDREVRRSCSILSGLPEPEIRPLLDKVRPWLEASEDAASPLPELAAREKESSLGYAITNREFYEAVLGHYARGEQEQMNAVWTQLSGRLKPGNPESKRIERAVAKMTFDLLEPKLMAQLETLDDDANPSTVQQKLRTIREQLDKAAAFRGSGRWKALDGMLRQRGSRLARQTLDRARALYEQDKIAEALEQAETARGLGDESIAEEAGSLADNCHQELKIRADRRAEAKAWQRIQIARDQQDSPSNLLKLYRELLVYGRRFPEGEHYDDARRLAQQVRGKAEAVVADCLRTAHGHLDRKQYVEARQLAESLEELPIPTTQQAEWARLKSRFDGLKSAAKSRLLLLDVKKRLFTEDSVLEVLAALPTILAMDPDNEEAQELADRARENGRIRAEKLLGSAKAFKKLRPEVARDKLERAVRLNPDGAFGQEAREMLDKMNGKGA